MSPFEQIFEQLNEILTEDDSFFAEANKQIIASFHEYFSSADVQAAMNEMLRKGDELGYTLEQYLDELSAVGSQFEASIDELRAKYPDEPHKQEFCDGFRNAINAFMMTAAEYIANRDVFNVAVELCHPNAKLPTYAHEGDWGADVYAVEDMTIEPGAYGVKVPTGLRMAIPHGWTLAARPRSGMSSKTPLRISNAPGTIDEPYRGEIMILFDNFSNIPVDIKAGDRIAQLGLEKTYRASYYQTETVSKNTNRGEGGFGSSGN